MYLVKTKSQLMDAVRENVRKIMVMGGWDPKMVAMHSDSKQRNRRKIPKESSSSQFLNDYNIFSIYDCNQNLIATVLQQRNEQKT